VALEVAQRPADLLRLIVEGGCDNHHGMGLARSLLSETRDGNGAGSVRVGQKSAHGHTRG
jgi:hypothetical protein